MINNKKPSEYDMSVPLIQVSEPLEEVKINVVQEEDYLPLS